MKINVQRQQVVQPSGFSPDRALCVPLFFLDRYNGARISLMDGTISLDHDRQRSHCREGKHLSGDESMVFGK